MVWHSMIFDCWDDRPNKSRSMVLRCFLQEASNTLLGLDETQESANHQKKWFLSVRGRKRLLFQPQIQFQPNTVDSIKQQNKANPKLKIEKIFISLLAGGGGSGGDNETFCPARLCNTCWIFDGVDAFKTFSSRRHMTLFWSIWLSLFSNCHMTPFWPI